MKAASAFRQFCERTSRDVTLVQYEVNNSSPSRDI